ncbi:MAG: repeat-containing protein, partial [Planctomycetota bacterium]
RVGGTNLAPIGLTAITGVAIVGSSDNETFLVQSPSQTLSFTIDGNGGTDIVKVQGTALADTMNVASSSGRILISKTTGVPFYVSATSEYMVVLGSDGNDTLDAEQVTAALTGLQLSGENGNDTLGGGLGDDAFVGGDGTDMLLEIGPGNLVLTDSVLQGHGTDSVGSDIEAIKLNGDAGNNLLDASGFTRFGVLLNGAGGNDTLLGSSKSDSLIGGGGIDEVRQAVSGNATLSKTLLTLGTSPNTISDGLSSIEKVRLTGDENPNKLDATKFTVFNGSVTLDGGAGNDTLSGGSGDDLLIGGPDSIPSGTDNDSLLGNAGNDTIKGGAGKDFIDGGDGNDGLAGGDDNDTIKGGSGNDTILGDAGNDSLRGGAGRDLIQGGKGKDNINGEGDIDTVMGGSGGGSDSGDKIFDSYGEVMESFRFTVDWLNLI